MCVCVRVREGQTERDREEREIDIERGTQRYRQSEGQREIDTER